MRVMGIASLGLAAAGVLVVSLRYPALERFHLWRLGSPDPEVRKIAAGKFGAMRSARAVPLLIGEIRRPANEWIHAPQPYALRLGGAHNRDFPVHFAVEPLARIGPPAVPALRDLLAHPREDVRLNAAIALLEIGPAAREAAGDLAARLQGASDVRPAAAKALARIGAAAVPLLIEKLEDGPGGVRYTAALALGEIGPPAIPGLVRSLGTAGHGARPYIAFSLWLMSSEPERAWPALIEARSDSGTGIPRAAIEALRTLERDGNRVVPILREAAQGPDEDFRKTASEILPLLKEKE
jgi:HEAT repeat protein